MMKKRIIMLAGGTGGHIFPALAVAKALQAKQYQVSWLGSRNGMENTLIPKHGLALDTIVIHNLRGKGWLRYCLLPWRLSRAVWQARGILKRRQADLVIGMGGFVAAPGALAAKWLGIPLVVHEQNSKAGWTNRWLARWASKVFCAYPKAFSKTVQAQHIGNPVRQELLTVKHATKTLKSSSLRILVLGGSQGAWAINQVLPETLAYLKGLDYQLWHQCGQRTYQATLAGYQACSQKVFKLTPFIEEMAQAYLWADLVICRAGALTVAELLVMAKPAIFIPLANAVDNHQFHNAQWLVKQGAACLLAQEDLTAQRLADYILLCQPIQKRQKMIEQAQKLAMPNATNEIVMWLEKFVF